MKIISYIVKLPIALNIAIIISFISIIVIDFYLKDIEEIVSWGSEFGNIYYRVCLSMIASYVFYFIVIHLKSMKDKENVNKFISFKVSNILSTYNTQINEIKKLSNNIDEKKYFKLEELEKLFKNINPNAQAPLILGTKYATWMQYFQYNNKRTQKNINKIFVQMPFLDSELVDILAHIEDNHHFDIIDLISSLQFNNKSMESFASSFDRYANLCQKLEVYYDKKLIIYKKVEKKAK